MYRVAICDDEATSLQINEALTSQVLTEEGIQFETVCFTDMESMIETLADKENEYDVLLCDILAVGMNGIEAAKELRRLGEGLSIIFISSTAEYALEGYQVDALRYLQKPIQIEKLREALLSAYKMKAVKGDTLTFQVGDKLYKIPFGEIEYLESQGRETIVCTLNEQIAVHMKFSDMEQLLPDDVFVRCHRSYIVNMNYVKDLARYRFLTKRGVEIPVSQLQYVDVKKKFMEF
ncbi:MAG: LytTR family DNA-binding domain-containing protein [Lachnospiraceae bacterium]|nr:LytTR family DNA-binding domain-containing protein [Lachnospiraceae bacterium]